MSDDRKIEFDWDNGNSNKSWIKHKVTKEEQEEAFYNKKAVTYEDPKHSGSDERRFLLFSETKKKHRLVIAFTIRNEKIRCISARPINRKEVDKYEKKA